MEDDVPLPTRGFFRFHGIVDRFHGIVEHQACTTPTSYLDPAQFPLLVKAVRPHGLQQLRQLRPRGGRGADPRCCGSKRRGVCGGSMGEGSVASVDPFLLSYPQTRHGTWDCHVGLPRRETARVQWLGYGGPMESMGMAYGTIRVGIIFDRRLDCFTGRDTPYSIKIHPTERRAGNVMM